MVVGCLSVHPSSIPEREDAFSWPCPASPHLGPIYVPSTGHFHNLSALEHAQITSNRLIVTVFVTQKSICKVIEGLIGELDFLAPKNIVEYILIMRMTIMAMCIGESVIMCSFCNYVLCTCAPPAGARVAIVFVWVPGDLAHLPTPRHLSLG